MCLEIFQPDIESLFVSPHFPRLSPDLKAYTHNVNIITTFHSFMSVMVTVMVMVLVMMIVMVMMIAMAMAMVMVMVMAMVMVMVRIASVVSALANGPLPWCVGRRKWRSNKVEKNSSHFFLVQICPHT